MNVKFKDVLNQHLKEFQGGRFEYKKDAPLSETLKTNNVPDAPSVYVISVGSGNQEEFFYIGKAGTLMNNGKFKKQKLLGRMQNIRKGKRSQEFYNEEMEKIGIDRLNFYWLVTFDEKKKVIPAKVEADLFQAFYSEYKCLPKWNDGI